MFKRKTITFFLKINILFEFNIVLSLSSSLRESNNQVSPIRIKRQINIKTNQNPENSLSFNFPNQFSIDLNELDSNATIEFVKISDENHPIHGSNFFIFDPKTQQPLEYKISRNFLNQEKYKFYKQINGNGFATLIINPQKTNDSKFRMFATVNHYNYPNKTFDIYPINHNQKVSKNQRIMFDTIGLNHEISIRNSLDVNFQTRAYDTIFNALDNLNKPEKKRANDQQPIQLYVETLMVVDQSVYNKVKEQTRYTNQDSIFQYIRIYLSHMINGVNSIYENSFKDDPNLMISVKLANFYFLTDSVDWSDPSKVGFIDSNQLGNRGVVKADVSLNSFVSFMENQRLKINYDHAIGLINKDLNENGNNGIIGYAVLNSICKSLKYSLVKETVSFTSYEVMAHELGHSLGSNHDGDKNDCPSNKFVMAPMQSNSFLMSRCSINQLKTYLLSKNGVSNEARCLLNDPNNLNDFSNKYLPGQIWSLDDQCEIKFGKGFTFFGNKSSDEFCETLYCKHPLKGENSDIFGAFEGTSCGQQKFCIQGECVKHQIKNISVTPCQSNPCLNGGVCKPLGTNGYLCECKSNETGLNCQSKAEDMTSFMPGLESSLKLILLLFLVFLLQI